MSTANHEVARLIDPEHIDALDVLGPKIQFLTPLVEGAPCVMRGVIPPSVAVPLHSHEDPETFLLLSGSVEGLVASGDGFQWTAVEPGQAFHVPPHAKHAWKNQGRTPAVMLLISTAKMGRFFQEIGKPEVTGGATASPSPEQLQRFAGTARDYGYWNASPEENARIGIEIPP